MPISFTPSQRAAVEYSRGNLLLSAAAGSGKTAALTARIARLLLTGEADLSEMLVVTYTRAAAAEMRERIGKRLREALGEAEAAGDERTASLAARALSALPAARVSTIHAFLYQALRPYFPALGLSPDARILDEQTVDVLRAEIMRDTVDDAFRSAEDRTDDCASFPELCDILGQARDTDAVDGELLWLDRKLAATGGDPATLSRFADSLDTLSDGTDFLRTPYGEEIRNAALAFAAHYIGVFSALAEELPDSPKAGKQYGPVCAAHLGGLSRIRDAAERCDSYDELRAAVKDLAFERLPVIQKKDATEVSETFKYFRDELKKEHAALSEELFSAPAREAAEAARLTARILRRAAVVLADFDARLAACKRDLAALDYGDLETGALRLFLDADGRRTRAAEEIGGAFRYVFIDEYQDTNDVQDRIFRALSPAAHRFMVGDIKQSIYRFRGADPSVFSGYRDRWPTVTPEDADDGPVLTGDEGRALFMRENFRCAAPVVAFANAVSRCLLPHGNIGFREDGDLLVHARADDPNPAPDAEIVLVERRRKKPGEPDDDESPAADPEAEYVADRIASMIGKYAGSGTSLLAPDDFAILLRSNRSASVYREALERRNIPAVMKTAAPLGESPAVMLLVCLFQFVDNPLRDVYTAGALRSPIFSVDLSMMISIREAAGDMPLWTGVVSLADRTDGEIDPALRDACRAAVGWLGRHKQIARSLPADKYLETLLADTDFFSLDGIRENGAERDAVNRFSSAVRAYEAGVGAKIGGVSGLLEGIDELLSSADDAGGGIRAKGAVSILSIHASKGLEFPVCFLCECAKHRNEEDERRTVLYDRELGLGMTLPDPGGLARCDTLLRRSVSAKLAREAVAEEMRMLYVAMTRARDRLIVTGKTPDPDRTLAEAALEARFADGYRAMNAGSYLAWICEAAEKTHLRTETVVVRENGGEPDTEAEAEPFVPEQLSLFPEEPEETARNGEATEREAEKAALLEEIRRRFAYAGEDSVLRRVPAKLTVSRLSPEILDADADASLTLSLDPPKAESDAEVPGPQPALTRPTFLTGGKEATPADRGSATHVFLQFTDHKKLRENGVAAEIERLVKERYLSAASASLLYEKQLERFRGSALLDALLRSPLVKREFRFNVLLPAARFTADPDFAAKLCERDVKVTVQGVVDCVYRDPDSGRLILVDYKTDRLTAEELRDPALAAEKLRARHRNQLTYYREICSAMFGEEIAEARVYSTVSGRCVTV
ncbi:MAG: UvrD-helicase domain-containing protein [Clostridia bacterium]|nr:UvrD-helicase domain-containing protein [Clostridia bacterium]